MEGLLAWLAPRAEGEVRKDLQRIQLILLIGVGTYVFYLVRWGVDGFWPAASLDLAGVLVNGALLAHGRGIAAAACVRRNTHLAVFLNSVIFLAIVPFTGGPDSGTHFFFPSLALVAFMQLGVRAGLGWTAVLSLAVLAEGRIPAAEFVPTPEISQAQTAMDQAAGLVVLGLIAAVARAIRDANEAALKVARQEALTAAKARERFVATVSHELRTPLAGSLGTARVLLEELPEGPTREKVTTIAQCGERLEALLDDVIDHVALREGKLSLREVPYDPVAVADDVIELFRSQGEKKGLALRREGEAPRVFGDPRRIRQVLGNLVANAIKFTHEGAVVVRVTHSGARLAFEVQDTGIGIDDTAKVLAAFEQDDPSIARRYGGTGLGLSISKRLLERLGGGLDLESSPDVGTTAKAWVRAPVARADGASRRILVVEDNPTNASVTLAMLNHLGHDAQVVEDGNTALHQLEESSYDVVLLDLRLPDQDGLSVFEAIKGKERRPRVVALSANVEERDACLDAGMDAFVAKPCKLEELAGALTI